MTNSDLVARLTELSERGVGFDMNPTMMFDSMESLWQQWHAYFARHDAAWRERVDAAMADLPPVDWRVLGGVIPGPIPAEWVRVGDTIRDHGVTGTITRATRSGGMVHLVIGSGHVSFAKVAQQDFVHVTAAGKATS